MIPLKALVVDDSSFMRNMMKNILDDLDFEEIYEAGDGKEAIEIHENRDVDLITLDIIMDDVGGIEALEEIRADNEDVKIIMVSAVGQDNMVEEAKEKGADTFINKPFEEDDVKETVTDLII